MPKFDPICAVCMQEEKRLATRGRIHGTQHEESQALTLHVKEGKGKGKKFHGKKGKGKGKKFHGKKGKGGRSSPTSD